MGPEKLTLATEGRLGSRLPAETPRRLRRQR
jgi:hypothetical protein